MKKRLMILAVVLLAAMAWLCPAGAESKQRDMKIGMILSSTTVSEGETIRVQITLTNTSGKDFPGPAKLFGPNGKKIKDFSEPVLKDGESVSWEGDWTVTEKQLNEGRITYTVRYPAMDENGVSRNHAKHFSKKITAAQPDTEPAPEDFAEVLLYGVCQSDSAADRVSVGCVDTAGDVWLAEQADVEWPCTDEAIREMLKTRRQMKKYENAVNMEADGTVTGEAWFAGDVPAMLDAIPLPEEKPRETGTDAGLEAVFGLRKNAAGEEESVLLGMAGSYMYENPSPDAQRLYLYMWRLMTLDEIFSVSGGYAAEQTSPQGFRGVPVREFYGLADGDLGKASVSAVYLDAEGGPREKELTPEEAEELRALAERGMIIRKENRWSMPEDVLTCTFTDEQGKELGQIRLFSYTVKTNEDGENVIATLAAAEDGMYQTALMPEPVDSLTEEELRMLTVTIKGVDYTVGKSTPRDLIRSGWNCFPELIGAFTFENPETDSTIEVRTAGCSLDEPIISISCEEDGVIGVPGAGQEGRESGESVCYPLSNGSYLYNSSSHVSLTLSESGPEDSVE